MQEDHVSVQITGGRVLVPGSGLVDTDVLVEEGVVAAVGSAASRASRCLDVGGRLVLPGVVDIHGDGFERHIMPRPGVAFSHGLGLLDTDRTMLASGITTAYHGLTWSWEPGLRGRLAAYAFLEEFSAVRGRLGCDTLLHLRYETYTLGAVSEIESWIKEGVVDMLAFNDHVDHMLVQLDNYDKMSAYLHRTGLDRAGFIRLLDEVRGRAGEVPAGIVRLAAAAREHGLPMASHDDPDSETRDWYHGLGCSICEFPMDRATAEAAVSQGDAVVLGAPNALRGKSHAKRLMARDAIAAGVCTALSSDYYYPAPLQAAFALDLEGVCSFAAAWELVSSGPAQAAGLADRGAIEPGKRADLIVVDDTDPALPHVAMTMVGGEPVLRVGNW